MSVDSCIFCQIVEGKIPSARLYEDELVVSFLDINPINPGHALVVPKKHAATIFDMEEDVLARCAVIAARVARAIRSATGCEGLNVLQNNFRAAGQLIDHFHIHLIPRYEGDGFLTSWPGTPYPEGEMEKMKERITTYLK